MHSIDPALVNFFSFLRIKSVSSDGTDGTYRACAVFIADYMREVGLKEVHTIEFVPHKPVVIGTLRGRNSSAKSLLLTGHYDVVPAFEEEWSLGGPFEPQARPDGKIVARGTQDMKSVIVQYLEAIRAIKKSDQVMCCDVHVSVFPDEEIGGHDGAKRFVESSLFESMNIGMALDEGLANPTNNFTIFYGERAASWVLIKTRGETGHGSRFVENTAVEKASRILDRIYQKRAEQVARLGQSSAGSTCCKSNPKLGDVLTMNVTGLKAGVPSKAFEGGLALNVIPPEAELAIDIRVPLSIPDIEPIIWSDWIGPDNEGTQVRFIQKTLHPQNLWFDNENLATNKYIEPIIRAIRQFDCNAELDIFPAATDSRFLRSAGVPCIGFSPITNTPILLHCNDEYIDEKVFLEGIQVYVEIIKHLCHDRLFC